MLPDNYKLGSPHVTGKNYKVMEAQRKRKKLFSTEEGREMVRTVEGPTEELLEALHCGL